jgi:hypothetical protein
MFFLILILAPFGHKCSHKILLKYFNLLLITDGATSSTPKQFLWMVKLVVTKQWALKGICSIYLFSNLMFTSVMQDFKIDEHKIVNFWVAVSERDIISYHIISYHIISYHIISYHIISYHIISHHIISYHISYHIISYHIISYHIISYNLFSFCGSVQDYKIHIDMEIVIFA